MCLCVCVRICRQPVLPHASCIPHIPDGQLRLQEHPGTAHTVETTFSKHTLFSQSLSVCMYLSLQASQLHETPSSVTLQLRFRPRWAEPKVRQELLPGLGEGRDGAEETPNNRPHSCPV